MTGSSITDDATEDGRWLTYTELAKERGISRASAIRLVRRQRWRRQMGNDGEARVYVLSEHLPGGAPPVTTPVTTPVVDPVADAALETALAAIEAAHASEVAALRAQVDMSEQGRIAMQTLADRTLAQLADASARTDAEITTLRDVVDGLRSTVSRTEDRASRAENRATEAEVRVVTLEADLRERDDRLAQAEQGVDAAQRRTNRAEDRADGLRRRVDELETNLGAARVEARHATETVAALTRDEVARKARGRLRRVLAAWRGE
jgi:hypothetical protein